MPHSRMPNSRIPHWSHAKICFHRPGDPYSQGLPAGKRTAVVLREPFWCFSEPRCAVIGVALWLRRLSPFSTCYFHAFDKQNHPRLSMLKPTPPWHTYDGTPQPILRAPSQRRRSCTSALHRSLLEGRRCPTSRECRREIPVYHP